MASIRDPQIASFIGISYSFLILTVYLITISIVRDKYDLNIVINTIIITTAILSIYIIIEQCLWWLYDYKLVIPFCELVSNPNVSCDITHAQFIQSTYNFHGGMVRPKAFFDGYNTFGGFALPGFFLLLGKIKIKPTLFIYCITLIVLAAIILSLSRNAILGLSVGLIFYFFAISFMQSKLIFVKRI